MTRTYIQRMCQVRCWKNTVGYTLGKMNTTTTEGIREGECQKWDSVMHECTQDIIHGVYIIIIHVCSRVKHEQGDRT